MKTYRETSMETVKERLKEYSERLQQEAEEEKIKIIVEKCRTTFWEETEKVPASYFDFLYQQTGYIHKRWWGLQFLVLTLAWWCIYCSYIGTGVQSITGIMAGMFGILLIPELWKNKTCRAVEVEGCTYYSLRQIYAARLLAFGVVDVGLLSIFMVITSVTTSMRAEEMIVSFLLPFTVTCGILFKTLCSRHSSSQTWAFLLALFWIMVWVLIVLNDQIYPKISVSVWAALLILAICYLGYGIRRTLVSCESFWEENREWN